ncbi:MAG TPA: 4'-phosphopantetheinyl transferase superfamily protein [Thermoanaerobaculia bacterium]|nr:4'-phosphopantetheinyl transferase superfamily protein [Thermoanaerobaculia bacterium]
MAVLDRFLEPPARAAAAPAEGEVEVWTVGLDLPAAAVTDLARLLSAEERARAERFRFARHRRRFTVGRGVLRILLGRAVGVDPGRVTFRYGAKGKPYLAGPASRGREPEIHFNLSNSDELAVIALCREADLGADVERLRPMPDGLAIAERFFSAAERRVLAAEPGERRDESFFRCWTRKEAYLKAVGDGITVRLDAFDVTLAADEPPRMLSIDGDPGRAADWELVHLEPAPGYLGALALPARQGGWRLRGWRWPV